MALTTVEVSAVKIRRITSETALTSGCSDQYKDMLAIMEEFAGPRQRDDSPRPIAAGSKVCRYDVRLDADGDRIGQLSTVRVLTPEQVSALNGELTAVTRDPSCSRQDHTGFALVQTGGSGPSTLVAIGGCAVQQDGGWWRATDQLRTLVS